VRPGLDFRSLPSRYRFLLVNSQRESERILRDYLHERFGRSPEWGVTCTAVQDAGHHALATLQHADGREERVRCRYLVACDGVNSRIRGQLGLTQEGSDYAGTVLQNLDVELLDFPDDPAWMHYCMGPGHFVMAAKLPGKYTRLLMSQPADKADAVKTPHHVFGAILAQHFDGVRFGETEWHSRWGSVVRLAHSYRRGAVFLAGDAAHTHSTAGGQGMNCCMQDAWNLGWKLAYVLGGAAPERLLDSYERERKPIGEQVIGAASAIHELFMAGRNSGPEGLTALRDSGFLTELLGKVSGLSYHYRPEGAAASGLTMAGDRMPNLRLPANAGGEWLTDLLRHTGLTLLAALPGSADRSTESWLDATTEPYRGRVERRAVPNAPRDLIGSDGRAHYYLVRPDGYVAASAPEHERVAIERRLEELLVRSP
jgi:NADPH-dependent dioxygenase